MRLATIIYIVFILAMITGEIMCITKCATSDWEAPYKREIIYGVGAVSGFGGIIGYIDIKDGPKK
jgi:hypothetical protein